MEFKYTQVFMRSHAYNINEGVYVCILMYMCVLVHAHEHVRVCAFLQAQTRKYIPYRTKYVKLWAKVFIRLFALFLFFILTTNVKDRISDKHRFSSIKQPIKYI